MVTTRAPTQTWVARDGTLFLDRSSGITIGSGTSLSGAFLNAIVFEAAVKNVTVTPPETSWEKQDLLGEDTSSFQNQVLDEKPVGMATITGTLIVGEDETIEDHMVSGTVSSPGAYTRYQVGRNTTGADLSICVEISSTGDANYVAFVLDNAKATKWGDVRISGPDSHWEQDFTIMCLAKDFYFEFLD
jgi:hypothetical protein